MKLSYCATQHYESDRDHFLQCLFIPEEKREMFYVIGALNAELIQIHEKVSEEMIGHIRYAWWYEKIEAMYNGQTTQGHPVLESLAPLIEDQLVAQPQLLALVETYRMHYPEFPHDLSLRLDNLYAQLIAKTCPDASAQWEKAGRIIKQHRKHYPTNRYGSGFMHLFLIVKLLLMR